MFKRLLFRGLRTLAASALGMVVSKYAGDPIYGPLITSAGMVLDKLIRETFGRPEKAK